MNDRTDYRLFLDAKAQFDAASGFEPVWMPDFLFDFQAFLVDWHLRMGRSALFGDCGLGKTPMELVWAENVVRKENGAVLDLTPIAVGPQTIEEGAKFGIEVKQARPGRLPAGVYVTNYEKLHLYNPDDFVGVVGDESSILKAFDGVRRKAVTEFLRKMRYRLLATATAAPNDYTELGTHSEALGYLGHMDMLGRFFRNDTGTIATSAFRRGELGKGEAAPKWRFKGHAEGAFWRWVASWARAVRKPSDLGFDDGRFVLPPLEEHEHIIAARTRSEGQLFELPAATLPEQREERRRTLTERCEKVANLVTGTGEPFVAWCHLNPEGDLLERLIPDALQVSGSDSDEAKEEKFLAFARGQARGLITKPIIGGWGLNWQHCAHETFFPSHSFEQYYQCIRRCYRFGQRRKVRADIVATEGERGTLQNLQRKALQSERMFGQLVASMNDAMALDRSSTYHQQQILPAWLSQIAS